MKPRFRNILFSLSVMVYLLSIIGLSINKHFCEGELETISLMEKSACCEGETPELPDDCCSNETVYVSNPSESIYDNSKLSIHPFYFVQHFLADIFLIQSGEERLSHFYASPAAHFPQKELPLLMVFRI